MPGLGEAFIPPRLPRAAFPELHSPRLHAWHLLSLLGRVLYSASHRLIGSVCCSNTGPKRSKDKLSSTKGPDLSQNFRTCLLTEEFWELLYLLSSGFHSAAQAGIELTILTKLPKCRN